MWLKAQKAKQNKATPGAWRGGSAVNTCRELVGLVPSTHIRCLQLPISSSRECHAFFSVCKDWSGFRSLLKDLQRRLWVRVWGRKEKIVRCHTVGPWETARGQSKDSAQPLASAAAPSIACSGPSSSVLSGWCVSSAVTALGRSDNKTNEGVRLCGCDPKESRPSSRSQLSSR